MPVVPADLLSPGPPHSSTSLALKQAVCAVSSHAQALAKIDHCRLYGWLASRAACPVWQTSRDNATVTLQVLHSYESEDSIYYDSDDSMAPATHSQKNVIAVPAKPDDLTDIAYASLLFENNCMVSKSGCRTFDR